MPRAISSSERAQHLGLRLQAHVTDLVEEQSATIGAFKSPALFGRNVRSAAPGGSAVTISEELRLDVVLGDRGTVQFNEDAVFAQAFGVHSAADQLLASTALAEDEHTAVSRGHQLDLLAQRLHRHTRSGDSPLGGELSLELGVILAHLARLHGVLQNNQRASERQRLFKEVIRAQLRCAHGGFNRAVARDDDHLGHIRRVHLANLAQCFKPVAIR